MEAIVTRVILWLEQKKVHQQAYIASRIFFLLVPVCGDEVTDYQKMHITGSLASEKATGQSKVSEQLQSRPDTNSI